MPLLCCLYAIDFTSISQIYCYLEKQKQTIEAIDLLMDHVLNLELNITSIGQLNYYSIKGSAFYRH